MANKPYYGWTQESYSDREDVFARFPDAACCRQIHGTTIHYADSPGDYGDGDGLFTDKKDVLLTVRTADCNGIVLWDNENRFIMALHAGWKGTAQGILRKGIEIFTQQGVVPEKINIYFGPSARKCCYQIGEDIVGEFSPEQQDFITREKEFLFCDLLGMNCKDARSAGVLSDNIIVEKKCTICTTELFSFRRNKTSQRHLIFVKKGYYEN